MQRQRGKTVRTAADPVFLKLSSPVFSVLVDYKQQIGYCGKLSSIQLVLFGVPQGSVLGPLLYVLYTVELFGVVACRLRLHMPATAKCTSVRQPTTPLPPLSAS